LLTLNRSIAQWLFGFALLLTAAAIPAAAQAPHQFPFRATNYDVQTMIHPENETIQAVAKVDLVAEQVGRTAVVELHPDLHVNSVKNAEGTALHFERDPDAPLYLNIGLTEAATPGKHVTLTFDYAGPVSSDVDSPSKGVRFAGISKDSAYLLLPARWFPLTDYPSNRYTGTFTIVVPQTFVVTGTGKADPPTNSPAIGKDVPAQATYVFHCDTPAPVGTFVAGSLQLSPVQTQGYQLSIFTPPAQVATATPYADALARELSYFSETFGPMGTAPSLTVAQMPDGSLEGYSAPGLLLISARQWTQKTNERILAQLAAGQWWGDRVVPATPNDVWLTDGLSRYASAMYAEESGGVAALRPALDDFSVGALMYENASPIGQAGRLAAYSDQYQSVVVDKGAMVFHMLRTEIGDDAFTSLLHDFFQQTDGKTASIADFEKLAAAKAPAPKPGEPKFNTVTFFSQWLDSTGVPEFKMNYIVYRTVKGFKVVGKIQQDLDTFRMPVEVRVETEGNPETKNILVSGTTTDFEIDTFGMPKPNGITVDPNNNLLKGSDTLRVHAAIARGELLAEAGKYYDAVQQYQKALDQQANSSLAEFRMGEAMFYQKNYQSAANSFRAALNGDLDPKWLDVWSHIYIGKIYDLLGQRARAVNEYSLAQHTKDDTAGAQEQAALYLQKPYAGEGAAPAPGTATADTKTSPGDATKQPVLKRRGEDASH